MSHSGGPDGHEFLQDTLQPSAHLNIVLKMFDLTDASPGLRDAPGSWDLLWELWNESILYLRSGPCLSEIILN